MKDVLDSLERWREQGEDIAVATVISTWGSAPRPVGAKMITTGAGGIAGSVSAGCVEGAVISEGEGVLSSGKPKLLHYGVSDDDAWEVGLTCGGKIDVFVEPFAALDGVYEAVKDAIAASEPVAVIGVLEGPDALLNHKLLVRDDGTTEGPLDLGTRQAEAVRAALDLLAQESGGTIELDDDVKLFVDVYPTAPRLIIVGAVHFTEPLVTMANAIGFQTIVVDPRAAFATRERFPHADVLLQEWPQHALPKMKLNHSAYVVTLTHDPKVDDPALIAALQSDARYVGALGSKRTNAKRLERLREAGLSDIQIGRLHAPIGLDLGGRSTAEIAVAIIAEIVQVRNQKPVRETTAG
jgi:xanthine dehydrogenase accessory factor